MGKNSVLADALRLPPDERAQLALELLESVADEKDPSGRLTAGEWQAAWDEEITRRLAAIDAGTAQSIPATEAFQRLRDRFARQAG